MNNRSARIYKLESDEARDTPWCVLWTHSNCERAVYEDLTNKGYEIFFAKMTQWVANRHGKFLTLVPMFRSYLFIHHAINKCDYITICKTKGLVRILGESWDRLATVPDAEMTALKSLCASEMPVTHHKFLTQGSKVRVTRGSLKDCEGILLETDKSSGLLVVSVTMLNRSLAVQIDCTDVVAA